VTSDAGPDDPVMAHMTGRRRGGHGRTGPAVRRLVIEGGEVVGVELAAERLAQASQDEQGVAADGCGPRTLLVERDGSLALEGVAGGGEHGAPVGAAVGQVFRDAAVRRGVATGLEPGPVRRGVVGEEAGQARELDDGQQPAGGQEPADLAQGTVGVGHVVQRRGGPHQAGSAEAGPLGVEVGLHGLHPVAHPGPARLLPRPLQMIDRGVDRRDVGVGEALQQREGAGAGAGTQVHDPSGGGAHR